MHNKEASSEHNNDSYSASKAGGVVSWVNQPISFGLGLQNERDQSVESSTVETRIRRPRDFSSDASHCRRLMNMQQIVSVVTGDGQESFGNNPEVPTLPECIDQKYVLL